MPQILKEEEFDMPLGVGTGAAVIFGVTGGVTEAVLRRLSSQKDYAALREISFTGIVEICFANSGYLFSQYFTQPGQQDVNSGRPSFASKRSANSFVSSIMVKSAAKFVS